MTLPNFRPQRGSSAAAGEHPGRSGRETLRFPLPAPVRLAVIDAELQLDTDMRAFKRDDIAGLQQYAPEALALPLSAALSFADWKLRGLMELPSLKVALVVFSAITPEPGILAPHHRDLLWKAFGLPVFEQLRGSDGRVIARECEVHDGLHLDAATAAGIATGFSVEVDPEACACGLETPRLRCLRPMGEKKARAAAA